MSEPTEQLTLTFEPLAYIYGIKPITGDVFYIGSTKHTLKHRFKQHLDGVKYGSHCNKHLANKIKKLGFDNIQIVELESVPLSLQFTREHEVIQEHIKAGKMLTNIVTSYPDAIVANNQRYELPVNPLEFVDNVLWFANYPPATKTDTKLIQALDDFLIVSYHHIFYGCQENIEAMRDYLGENLLQSTIAKLEASSRFPDIYASR